MQSWAETQAQAELHNPMSPYFIGKPTVPDQIRQYLNGTCRVNSAGYYNTNYFGSGKKSILARPTTDSVEILGRVKERNKRNSILSLIGLGITTTVGFFLLRKLPGADKVPSILWTGMKYSGKGLSAVLKGIGWIFKK